MNSTKYFKKKWNFNSSQTIPKNKLKRKKLYQTHFTRSAYTETKIKDTITTTYISTSLMNTYQNYQYNMPAATASKSRVTAMMQDQTKHINIGMISHQEQPR